MINPQAKASLSIELSENGGFVITTERIETAGDAIAIQTPRGTITNTGQRIKKVYTATSVDDAMVIIRDKMLELQ